MKCHLRCTHKKYRFNCDEFDRLLARAKHRCEICRQPFIQLMSHGIHVDHDHAIAQWAVRGVLCQGCNTYELPYRKPSEAVLRYLANPWYLTLIRDAGVTLAGPPEPDLGTQIVDRVGIRKWRHGPDGWSASSRPARPWSAVIEELGPHNIVVVRPGVPIFKPGVCDCVDSLPSSVN